MRYASMTLLPWPARIAFGRSHGPGRTGRADQAAGGRKFADGVPKPYANQIAHELRLIDQLGYAPYFLTIRHLLFDRGAGGNRPHPQP